MNDNPITDLLIGAMECADRLPDAPETALSEAVEFVGEVAELPEWLPAFMRMVHEMIKHHRFL